MIGTDNIILIGMPGCGKTTLGRALAKRLGREAFDCDDLICQTAGMSVQEIFRREGEPGFRVRESDALRVLCARRGCVIATGGGCVTREENHPLLRGSGRILWIRRELALLPTEGRPISLSRGVYELYAGRRPLYERLADASIENNGTVEEAVLRLLHAL